MEFNLVVFVILLMIYGIVRCILFFKKTGNFIYVVVISVLLVILTNSWIETYGGRVGEMYKTWAGFFNIIPLGILFAYLYLESLRKKEREEKERIRNTFGKYVSEKVVKQLLSRKEIGVGGRRQEISVLFTDIRGFTSMSETLPPEEVVSLLNKHFNVLTKIAFEYGGTVDKFIGDSVMVIFGAPIYQKDHAERAVKCAIEMQKKMDELNKKLEKEEGKKGRRINIGISINSGEAIIGNIGSDQFMDYTAVGDIVNTASRLQAVAEAGDVIISENTYQKVKRMIFVKKRMKIKVKGKKKPIVAYSVKF